MRLSGSVWGRLAVIALIIGLSVLFFAIGAAYTDFFYLALILAAFWYRERAVYAGILLAMLYAGLAYPPGPGTSRAQGSSSPSPTSLATSSMPRGSSQKPGTSVSANPRRLRATLIREG